MKVNLRSYRLCHIKNKNWMFFCMIKAIKRLKLIRAEYFPWQANFQGKLVETLRIRILTYEHEDQDKWIPDPEHCRDNVVPVLGEKSSLKIFLRGLSTKLFIFLKKSIFNIVLVSVVWAAWVEIKFPPRAGAVIRNYDSGSGSRFFFFFLSQRFEEILQKKVIVAE